MGELIIREAKIDDALAIAKVHVLSWQETYKGIIPDSYLQNLSIPKRQEMWVSILGQNKNASLTFVAQKQGEVIGFVNGGKAREEKLGLDGELYAIYLLKKDQGRGKGQQLFLRLIESFKNQSYKNMYLWVLRDNPTISFYQKRGGLCEGQKEEEIGGKKLIEDLYVWNEI